MHPVCSSFNDLWIKCSGDEVKQRKNPCCISLGDRHNFEITLEVKHVIMLPIGMWLKESFVISINYIKIQNLDKRQTTRAVIVSGAPFFFLSPDRRLKKEKERLIVGYKPAESGAVFQRL